MQKGTQLTILGVRMEETKQLLSDAFGESWQKKVLKIGENLVWFKGQIGHGEYQKWIEDNFSLSYASANAFVRVYENYKDQPEQMEGKNFYLLNELSLGTTSKQIKKEVAKRISKGETVTRKQVQEMKRKEKKPKQEPSQPDILPPETQPIPPPEPPPDKLKTSMEPTNGVDFNAVLKHIDVILNDINSFYTSSRDLDLDIESKKELLVRANKLIKYGHALQNLCRPDEDNNDNKLTNQQAINLVERFKEYHTNVLGKEGLPQKNTKPYDTWINYFHRLVNKVESANYNFLMDMIDFIEIYKGDNGYTFHASIQTPWDLHKNKYRTYKSVKKTMETYSANGNKKEKEATYGNLDILEEGGIGARTVGGHRGGKSE